MGAKFLIYLPLRAASSADGLPQVSLRICRFLLVRHGQIRGLRLTGMDRLYVIAAGLTEVLIFVAAAIALIMAASLTL